MTSVAHPPALAYTVEQAADRVNLPETKLWQAIKEQKLRSFKFGRSRRVSERALIDFIELLESREL
jgi:excisionase family DNA binding protein